MAKRLGVTVSLFLVVAGVMCLVCKSQEERFENSLPLEEPGLERVRQYRDKLLGREGSPIQNKDALVKVIGRYEDYIEKHPDSARAYNDLGDILYDYAGQFHEAVKKWQKAVEVAPDFAEAHNSLAVHYDHYDGDPIRGIEEVKKAIQLDPDVADYHFNLATFYFAGRFEVQKKYGWDLPKIYEACLREYEEAVTLDPENFDFAADYARTYYFAKYFQVETDYDAAIAAWKYCLGLDIGDYQKSYVLLYMAYISEECGRPDQVRKYAEAILKIDPEHAAAKRLIERASASKGFTLPFGW